MIEIGTEIYYHGDMANQSGFFKVVNVDYVYPGQSIQGAEFELQELDGEFSEGRKFKIFGSMIDAEYKGHGGTRFVTRAAYDAYRAELLAR
jgi:hypothetical protein